MKKTLLALVPAILAVTSQTQASPIRYGMIGLTAGETLRINVANPELPDAVPPRPCVVELAFRDSSGELVLPAVQDTLQAGKSAHYDLNSDVLFPPSVAANLPAVQRAEIRPVVLVLSSPTATGIAAYPSRPCVSTIEILDNTTGKTLLSSSPQNSLPAVQLNPQPEPPYPAPPPDIFGQMGIVSGQTIRLNAVNTLNPSATSYPPSPCLVTLVFFDEDGNVLAHFSQVLQPGQAGSLDYSLPAISPGPSATTPDGTNPPTPERKEVRAVMTTQIVRKGRFPPSPCRATLEVFDDETGRTTAIQLPAVQLPAVQLPRRIESLNDRDQRD